MIHIEKAKNENVRRRKDNLRVTEKYVRKKYNEKETILSKKKATQIFSTRR